MKMRIGIILTAFALLGVAGCDNSSRTIETIKGSWKFAEKKVAVGDIRDVVFYNPGDLHIEVGQKPELRIEADDNILPYLIGKAANGKLEIFAETGVRIGNYSAYAPPNSEGEQYHVSRIVQVRLIPRRRIQYYLTVSGLEGITAWNSGKVNIPDLEEEKISIVSGSSGFSIGKLAAREVSLNPGGDVSWNDTHMRDMNIESVSAEELKVRINSNQNVNIARGEVHKMEIVINDRGNYYAPEVNCTEADVRVTGQGSVTIRVTKRLDVRLGDSGGNVYYLGNPETSISGQSENTGKLLKVRE